MRKGFKRATKKAAKLRIGLIGPAGAGKTFSALKIARGLAGEAGRIAVIDSERKSASLYADDVAEFDVIELETHAPEEYVRWIEEAGREGYDVLVIDSLSHAWAGKDGILEYIDKQAKRNGGGFGAWRDATPKHNALVDAILSAPCHVIVTLRAKTEYVQEKDDRTGKTVVRKVGLQPVQRDGLEYEFTVVGDITAEHDMVITKTRCPLLTDAIIPKPDERVARTLLDWLSNAAPEEAAPPPPAEEPRKTEELARVRSHVEKLGMKEPERDPAALLEALQGAAHAEDRRAYYLDWQRSRRLDGRGLRLLGALLHGDANAEGGKEPEDGMGEDERNALAEAYALLDEQDAAAERAAVQAAEQPSLVEGQAAPWHAGPVGQVER